MSLTIFGMDVLLRLADHGVRCRVQRIPVSDTPPLTDCGSLSRQSMPFLTGWSPNELERRALD
jgi:hypothetical protein